MSPLPPLSDVLATARVVALPLATRFRGIRTPEQGAATPLRLATLPDDGPTGGFFEDAGVVPW